MASGSRPGPRAPARRPCDERDKAMSAHSVPLHCPYCGGEFLFPHEQAPGSWECRECLRAYRVKFLGLLPGRTTTDHSAVRQSAVGPSAVRASTVGGDQ
jgi:hypothetical protein